jgi:transglutaminase-like putative cysteine protease
MTENDSQANPAPAAACTRIRIDSALSYQLDAACDFVFLIHAANGPGQTIAQEELRVEPPTPYRAYVDAHSGNRFLRLQAGAGPFTVIYRAVVDRLREPVDPAAQEMPVHELPDDVLRFLLPTRYCESDLLAAAAVQLFGALPRGHSRVQAVSDWVQGNIAYRIGSTNATTTARDVFAQRTGVCRDYAHLAITFCRALNIPARLVSAYARFPEPPPDFHAVFEAYLGGRWVLFDPSGMAPVDQVVRVATGRDAKDVAFATIFGPARMTAMSPEVEPVGDCADAA